MTMWICGKTSKKTCIRQTKYLADVIAAYRNDVSQAS